MHKFKVWDPNTKTMEGYMDGYFTLEDFMNGSFPKCFLDKWNRVRKDLMFLQYTGLEDKKGREIFTGDILRSSKDGEIKLATVKVSFYAYGFYAFDHEIYFQDCTVVGNIYENPEMLK